MLERKLAACTWGLGLAATSMLLMVPSVVQYLKRRVNSGKATLMGDEQVEVIAEGLVQKGAGATGPVPQHMVVPAMPGQLHALSGASAYQTVSTVSTLRL